MRTRIAPALAGLVSASLLVAHAHGNVGAHDGHHHVTIVEYGRPEVSFKAGNEVMEIPDEVPSGYVDIRVEALETGEAHLAFGRLVDGVTFEEISTQPDGDLASMVTNVVGNGTISPGHEVLLTAEMTPGDWVAINIYFDGGEVPQFAFDSFTVVDSDNPAPAPEADGTIVLGPGMRMQLSDDFEPTGVWKVENHDEEQMHEPAIVGLADDATAEDLITALADPQGPPPIRGEFGGMGALSPGHEAWVTFEDGALEPGNYALICWVPDANGVPHLMSGMFEDFVV